MPHGRPSLLIEFQQRVFRTKHLRSISSPCSLVPSVSQPVPFKRSQGFGKLDVASIIGFPYPLAFSACCHRIRSGSPPVLTDPPPDVVGVRVGLQGDHWEG